MPEPKQISKWFIDTFVRKFLSKLSIGDDCWEWTGRIDGSGYGQFRYYRDAYIPVHRFSYGLFKGDFDELNKMDVLHSCDNKKCCNPSHLNLGDDFKNQKDILMRGSYRFLTLKEVEQIRELSNNGENDLSLSIKFGVTQKHISRIRRNKRWLLN